MREHNADSPRWMGLESGAHRSVGHREGPQRGPSRAGIQTLVNIYMGCVSRREAKLGQNLTWGLSALWEPIVLSMAPLLISPSARVALPSFLEPGLRLIATTPGASLSGQPHAGRPSSCLPSVGPRAGQGSPLQASGACPGAPIALGRIYGPRGQIRFLLTSLPLIGDIWWAGLELGTPLSS